MYKIRPFHDSDWDSTWQIIEPVFRAGQTYPFPPTISKQESYSIWVATPECTYVAEDEPGQILGTYYLKPNQPGQGAHVCNCGYIVSDLARGRGVASAMCEHSQEQAIRLGYRAMQYNLVVSTNDGAVRLWEKHGFDVVGRLPGAFNHPTAGYVDALVMFKDFAADKRK
ncbi:GNAT family N-acetyltransferase [Stieleria mannarensis]|uniref:GNAT family N-acetyltransferase n=1 Tax=Stieleria mannarensis TaxID=2755585 RepID=UPI00160419A1|nr:GNAT family N-acetyltransferase [Rhodopirellula sp. JC639]